MAGSFRRAHLRGSEELFRPTRPEGEGANSGQVTRPAPTTPGLVAPEIAEVAHSSEALGVRRPDGRLLRLTDEEIEILLDAIQRLRYPTSSKPMTKPPVDVFERLGELRHKLQTS